MSNPEEAKFETDITNEQSDSNQNELLIED